MTTLDAVNIIEDFGPDTDKYIEAWQHLVDTGIVWKLQGFYARTAHQMIKEGILHSPITNTEDRS